MSAAKSKAAPVTASPAERIATARERIAEITWRLTEIDRAGPDAAEIATRVAGVVEDLRRRASQKAGAVAILGASAGGWNGGRAGDRIRDDLGALTAVDFTALVDPERLARWLRAEGESAAADGGERMPPAEVAAERGLLEAERLTHEVAEELAIREIEATGAAFGRRPDVDPAVVLAPDRELLS